MIRSLLLCLVALGLSATAASAATINLDYGQRTKSHNNVIAASQQLVTNLFQYNDGGVYSSTFRGAWTIPAVTAADIGHTFTLNAATAPSYGFDWGMMPQSNP